MDTSRELPKTGRPHAEVLKDVQHFGDEDPDYKKMKTWSLVYYLGEEHTEFLKEAYGTFFSANGLNPMAFKSLKRFESEVVGMTASLLHGGDEAAGTMTSGGTESCLLAVKTYRDYARKKKPWIRRPEMVIPETAHVAWEKGAAYFGVKPVRVPLDKEYRVNLRALKRRISGRTVMLLASAPEYPHGMVEPIAEIGKIAQRKKIPLHVDSCLGGYLLPFVEKLGYSVPPWDFRVPGVTSISADIHKYGFAAKGASTIIYRNVDYLRHQMFVFDSWPGGIFASPALLGTRPGGAIAAAWATMQALGEEGYLENARRVMAATQNLLDGVRAIPELEVVGEPAISIFAYRSRSPEVNIYAVADQLAEKGWHVDRLQKPDAIHAMATPLHDEVTDEYLADLREAVETVKNNPELATSGGAATYGMMSHVPLRGMIRKSVLDMMVNMYGPDGKMADPGAENAMGDDPVSKLANQAGMLYLQLRDRIVNR